jgi:Rod binding domain-containing protein
MNVDLSAALGQIATATPPATRTDKAGKAARDFESVLLSSLFDSLQKTFAWDSEDSTPGASNYRMMGTHALAESVSAQGGIGIARMILRHLPLTKVSGGS